MINTAELHKGINRLKILISDIHDSGEYNCGDVCEMKRIIKHLCERVLFLDKPTVGICPCGCVMPDCGCHPADEERLSRQEFPESDPLVMVKHMAKVMDIASNLFTGKK